jgi:hypothetical protein
MPLLPSMSQLTTTGIIQRAGNVIQRNLPKYPPLTYVREFVVDADNYAKRVVRHTVDNAREIALPLETRKAANKAKAKVAERADQYARAGKSFVTKYNGLPNEVNGQWVTSLNDGVRETRRNLKPISKELSQLNKRLAVAKTNGEGVWQAKEAVESANLEAYGDIKHAWIAHYRSVTEPLEKQMKVLTSQRDRHILDLKGYQEQIATNAQIHIPRKPLNQWLPSAIITKNN